MSRYAVDEETLRAVVRRLRAGHDLSDVEFDRIYPEWARKISDPHWTPIEVARRAAELLAVTTGDRILDVGAGVGKFCLIGALTTRATFVGIEQRGSLVDLAQHSARRSGALRAQFLHGNMMSLDWSDFDGLYLFNPYYEHIADSLPPIEGALDLSPVTYRQYVATTYQKLRAARIGTRVVTYHGYGGPMPREYRLLLHEPAGSHFLAVWEKELQGRTDH